jgi:hypothetical protein
MSSLDAHARPPEAIRSIYKQYQKLPKDEIDKDEGMVDFHRDEAATHFSLLRTIDSTSLSFDATQCAGRNSSAPRVASVYGTERLPGGLFSFAHTTCTMALNRSRTSRRTRFDPARRPT